MTETAPDEPQGDDMHADEGHGRSKPEKKRWFGQPSGMISLAALAIAGISALFSWQQAWTARDMEVRSLRAYVAPDGGKLDFVEARKETTLRLALRNFGSTPAFGVYIQGAISMVRARADRFYRVDRYTAPNQIGVEIYPGKIIVVTVGTEGWSSEPGPQDIEAFKDGTDVIIVYGTLYYTDVFGVRRATDICDFFTASAVAEGGGEECANHHGADEHSEGRG